MKIIRHLIAAAAVFTATFAPAAETKTATRVFSLLEIETDDPVAYAEAMKQYNEIAKARLGVDNYLRVYQTHFDGVKSGQVRVVNGAATVADLMKNIAALESDPAILQLQERIKGLRKRGSRVLYQSARFDGPNPPGSWTYNTLANVTDEPGYLKAIEQLRGIMDKNGFKDVRASVYRTVAGRTDHSHRITLTAPTREQLAAFLDFVGTNSQALEWLASSAKLRTVVRNAVAREITK